MGFARKDEVTVESVRSAYEHNGFKFYNEGPFDVNIFGIRSNGRESNKFDDMIGVIYQDDKLEWNLKKYNATTDPGRTYLLSPLNKSGTAILVPGQYKGSHMIGLHQGKYEALRQKGNLKLYRDNNKDNILDFNEDSIIEGNDFGINIHRATAKDGLESVQVDSWSAGCQVIAAKDDFEEFMKICRKARDLWGNSFTYTLFTEQTFFDIEL